MVGGADAQLTAKPGWKDVLERLDGYRWLLPLGYKSGMLVPGLILSNEGSWKRPARQ
jgi:hypothetical protein